MLSIVTGATRGPVKHIGRTPSKPSSPGSIDGHPAIVELFENASIKSEEFIDCQKVDRAVASATYLYGLDDKTCVTTMDFSRPVVVSGRYSGCMFAIGKIDTGVSFQVGHIYNAGSNSGLVEATRAYFKSVGATEVVALASSGAMLGAPGADSVWFVAELVEPRRVAVARLVVNGVGKVIKEDSGFAFGGDLGPLGRTAQRW